MEVALICSKNTERILLEMLENRNIQRKDDVNIYIIEKGFQLPEGKIGIYFEMNTLHLLMDFLDEMVSKEMYSKKMITGRYEDRYSVISYDEIICFEGLGNDVFCITKDRKYQIKEKLYKLEEQLQSSEFIRVSKGFIINIIQVDQIIPWFNGKLVLKMEDLDEEIHVSRSYAKEFKKFLGI